MNPYSTIDSTTLGYLGQAGIDPGAVPQQNAAYPTYPNAAGVGSQIAGVANQALSQGSPISDITQKQEVPDATSRGMSPYSLIGDANYRQK